MNPIVIAFLIGIGLSIITVVGDMLVKHASLQSNFSGWLTLIIGAIVYGLTAFGWFFVMRKIKLSTLGVLYAVSCVVLLTLISVFYFKQHNFTHLFIELYGIMCVQKPMYREIMSVRKPLQYSSMYNLMLTVL